jgi:hypothetical protein
MVWHHSFGEGRTDSSLVKLRCGRHFTDPGPLQKIPALCDADFPSVARGGCLQRPQRVVHQIPFSSIISARRRCCACGCASGRRVQVPRATADSSAPPPAPRTTLGANWVRCSRQCSAAVGAVHNASLARHGIRSSGKVCATARSAALCKQSRRCNRKRCAAVVRLHLTRMPAVAQKVVKVADSSRTLAVFNRSDRLL